MALEPAGGALCLYEISHTRWTILTRGCTHSGSRHSTAFRLLAPSHAPAGGSSDHICSIIFAPPASRSFVGRDLITIRLFGATVAVKPNTKLEMSVKVLQSSTLVGL